MQILRKLDYNGQNTSYIKWC